MYTHSILDNFFFFIARMLQERITPQDATILEHLVDIRGIRFGEEGSGSRSCGYIVKFVFSPNSHFSEEELSVKAEFADQEETVIRSIEGTSISWSSKGWRASPCVCASIAANPTTPRSGRRTPPKLMKNGLSRSLATKHELGQPYALYFAAVLGYDNILLYYHALDHTIRLPISDHESTCGR